ncbi:hypothetical protein [Salsipaludibacter albus]|uniref:hypothetical protein n=1 Tax=Salsipaludibacter albus TaxID=2849650 RepID=UPI001EE3E1FF|nr:hypothetical protein [Salsipaludibacter albus]MBY5161179.1 hypothetical protein [Salsipaludibacter albus]
MATTTTRRRPTVHTREPHAEPRARQTHAHEAGDLHDLASLLAAPIVDADQRVRVDRALALLLGPDGARAPHLQPTRRTPDVVRRRIAGRALARLSRRDVRHRHLVAGALAILRP